MKINRINQKRTILAAAAFTVLFLLNGMILINSIGTSPEEADSYANDLVIKIPQFAQDNSTDSEDTDDEETDESDSTEDTDTTDDTEESPGDEDEDGDDIDDETEEENERELQVEIEDKSAHIESELKVGDQKDKIKIELEAEDDVKIKAAYATESESLEIELEFKVKFERIYEFTDVDGDNIFNESVDTVEQEYQLDSFNEIHYSLITLADNSTIHYLNVSTTDGVFTLHFYMSGEFQKLDNVTLTPAEMKFDIEILNFPYVSETSLLALQTKLESGSESEYEEEEETEDEEVGLAEDEKGVSVEMNGQSGFFSWVEYAKIDGVDQLVLSSPVEDDDDSDIDEQKFYLNYQHGMSILHDPKVGVKNVVNLPPPVNNDNTISSIPGYTTWAFFAALAIGSILLIRKNRK